MVRSFSYRGQVVPAGAVVYDDFDGTTYAVHPDGEVIDSGSDQDTVLTSAISEVASQNQYHVVVLEAGTIDSGSVTWNQVVSVEFLGRSYPETSAIDNTDSPYTASEWERLVFVDSSSATVTVNLPDQPWDGMDVYVKQSGANAVTVDGQSHDIDGSGTTNVGGDGSTSHFKFSDTEDEWKEL